MKYFKKLMLIFIVFNSAHSMNLYNRIKAPHFLSRNSFFGKKTIFNQKLKKRNFSSHKNNKNPDDDISPWFTIICASGAAGYIMLNK